MAQDDFNQFVERVKSAESRGRRYDKNGNLLTSPKGAEGEMQVLRGTQKSPGFGVEPAKGRNPEEIARVGRDYLAAMKSRYGNETLAAIAYNWGPGNTDKWIAAGADFSKLPKETQDYVAKVAPTVSRETKAAPAAPTEAERMMKPALESGVTARAPTPAALTPGNVAALGKDYKAALALSFLSGEDDIDEDTVAKFREREEEAATDAAFAPKPINALADLDLTSAPVQGPQFFADGGDVVASNMPFNPNPYASTGAVMMAGGGDPADEMTQEPLQERSTAMGYANTRPPTRSAQQLQAYMESMNPTVQVNQRPLEPGELGYVEPDPILDRPGAPNVLNINTQQSPGTAETTKLHELEHTLDLRGGDILRRPKVRYTDNNYRAYYLMDRDWRPINETVENFVNNREKLEQFFGRPIESGYFKTGSLENLKSEGNQRALFKEQLATLSALEQVTGKSLTRDPEMRSLFPSTKMMAVYDALTGPRQTRLDARDLPPHTPQPSYTYETNPIVRFIKEKLGPSNEYGVPVRRADGSPETGEVGPYIGNPNIQRQGVAARRLAALRDVNTLPDPRTYAAVSGFLGTPPTEQGFSVMHPDLPGIQKAGDIGFGLGTAAAVAPVVGPAAKMLGKMAGSALNERMLSGQSLTPGFNTPAPISFAVKPEQGGFFLTSSRTGSDEVDSFLRHFAGVNKNSQDPLNQWMYKRYSNYMRGTMGTEADPFVKGADAGRQFHFMDQAGQAFRPQYVNSVPYVRQTMGLPEQGFAKTPSGQSVETAIDASMNPIPVKDVGDFNLSPKMKELAAKNPDAPVYEIMMEEMDNVLKPEELRLSLRAMLEDKTLPPEYRLTEDQLQKMSLLEASEKVAKFDQYVAAKDNEAMLRGATGIPVFKEYDDGYRWLAPDDVKADDRSKRFVLQAGKSARWCTEKESSCLDYASGDSRVLILAAPDGKPAVQMNIVTVSPDERVYDWIQTLPHSQARELKDNYFIHQIQELPEFKQWMKMQPSDEIGEIKGRYNERDLTGEELAKARDVVRSGNWARVKDLENVKLTDAEELYPADVIQNVVLPRFGTRYLTDEEINAMRTPDSFATGGMIERRTDDSRRYL